MTTVQITLLDQLAQEAQRAGLLSSESMEELLRGQLKVKAAKELAAMLDKLDAAGNEDYMSPEEIAEEIRAMRAEKRAPKGETPVLVYAFNSTPASKDRLPGTPAGRSCRSARHWVIVGTASYAGCGFRPGHAATKTNG